MGTQANRKEKDYIQFLTCKTKFCIKKINNLKNLEIML